MTTGGDDDGGQRRRLPMPLEILHRFLMLRGGRARTKFAQIAPPAGARVFLAGIEPVFAGGEFADHDAVLMPSEPMPLIKSPPGGFRRTILTLAPIAV